MHLIWGMERIDKVWGELVIAIFSHRNTWSCVCSLYVRLPSFRQWTKQANCTRLTSGKLQFAIQPKWLPTWTFWIMYRCTPPSPMSPGSIYTHVCVIILAISLSHLTVNQRRFWSFNKYSPLMKRYTLVASMISSCLNFSTRTYVNRPKILETYINPLYQPNPTVIWPSVAPQSLVS